MKHIIFIQLLKDDILSLQKTEQSFPTGLQGGRGNAQNSECFFGEVLPYTDTGSEGCSNKSRRGSPSQNSASPLDYFTFFRVQAKSMERHFLLGDTFHELKYVPDALWWHFFPAQGGP